MNPKTAPSRPSMPPGRRKTPLPPAPAADAPAEPVDLAEESIAGEEDPGAGLQPGDLTPPGDDPRRP